MGRGFLLVFSHGASRSLDRGTDLEFAPFFLHHFQHVSLFEKQSANMKKLHQVGFNGWMSMLTEKRFPISLFVLGIAIFWIFSVPNAIAEPKAPDDVVQAAQQGLMPFLDKIPKNSLDQFGFGQTDSFDAAVLGTPFLVHTITPSALKQYQSGVTVASLLTPTTLWYFPVLIAGQPKAILVVDQISNQWQAVSLGYPSLAREWDTVCKQWPEFQGYHPVLITIFQAHQHVFTVPEKGNDNLTTLLPPIQQIPNGMGQAQVTGDSSRYAILDNATKVIRNLMPVVENNLRESNP